jgi:hypothetical protein
MFSEVEGHVLEVSVQPPPPIGQIESSGQTAPRGATPLRPLFLLKLLMTKWMIGERL